MTVASKQFQQTADTIRAGGVELSPAGIKPVAGNLATLVKAENIKEIVVQYGFRSHHPFVQLIFGAALCLLLPVSVKTILLVMGHSVSMLVGGALLSVPGVLGVWLVFDSESRGYFLRIIATRGKHKVSFDRKTPAEAVRRFCEVLRDRKYKVVFDAVL